MGGKSSGSQTVDIRDPRAEAQLPFLTQGYQQAGNYLQSPGNFLQFPGATVSPFNVNQKKALNQIKGIAQRPGMSIPENALAEANKTLSGGYLGANPYLDAQFAQAEEKFRPNIDGGFGLAGRAGSGAHANALADAYAGATDAIYGGHYENERDRQLQTLGLSPQINNLRFSDANTLLGVGNLQQQQQQSQLTDKVNSFNFARDRGSNVLANYMNLIGSPVGQLGSQTQPTFSSPIGSALGGASTGAGLASALGIAGPWGAIGGGILGLLGGL